MNKDGVLSKERVRGFEFIKQHHKEISKIENDAAFRANSDRLNTLRSLRLPKRATGKSAGYDFMASDFVTVPSMWKQAFKYIQNKLFSGGKSVDEKLFKPTLVPTNVKAYMQDDEYLFLANRSSNPLKKFLVLSNSVGIIDKDYYNNPDNDGHIMFQFLNFGIFDQVIKPGDKIGQGIFHRFLKADDDHALGIRAGGHGSTDRNPLEGK